MDNEVLAAPFNAIWPIFLAVLLDIILGDPHWLPHPVVAVGKLAEWLEKGLRARMRNLRHAGVCRATVETVAENTTDGVIAPLLFMLAGSLFGMAVPLVWAFKAASTLDSMVGYKNDRYLDMGRFSARLDDVLNFIPARVTGVCLCAAAFFCRFDARGAWRVLWRDHANHPSPNSAWAEAAAAGALGIQLGGGAFYGGQWVEKKTIGDACRSVEPEDIRKACLLMWVTYAGVLMVGGLLVLLLKRGF